MSEFDSFWQQFPRREGRLAAMREYIHARRLVSAETIAVGLTRYLEHLPRERQYIQKPANWLRDGAWDNEYDEPVRAQYPDCEHEPRCSNKVWCSIKRQREQAS